jgi:DNA-binding beta-propeller fold protein YncE
VKRLLYCACALALPWFAARAQPSFVPEATIPLPHTLGRIDHMAIDPGRKHLFVAELGNGTVDVLDLAHGRVIHRIAGLDEPQGIAYAPQSDRLVIACGGDGMVRVYSGADFSPKGSVNLGADADNVHVDSRTGHGVVGFGRGGLAIIDPGKAAMLGKIDLPGHPEGFQLSGAHAYVNVPDAGLIADADLDRGVVLSRWSVPRGASNFPMAVFDGKLAVVFRGNDRLALFATASGRVTSESETCGDADDVFFDAKRKRLYVSCWAGAIDVVASDGASLRAVEQVRTSWGARTSLFDPTGDRLYVAVRAGLLGSNASIQVYRFTR